MFGRDDARPPSPTALALPMGNGQSSRGESKADEAPSIPRRRRRATGCWMLKMCSSKQRRSIREHKKAEEDVTKAPPSPPPVEAPIETPEETVEEVRFRAEEPPRTPPRPPTSLPLKQRSINNNFEVDFTPTPLSPLSPLSPGCDPETPSLPASTVLCSWKNRSLRPSGGDSTASTCSVDVSELNTPSSTPLDHGGLSLHSYDSLMQIIRCFPFPSPKSSPRVAKRLSRTMSDDEPGISLQQVQVVGSPRPPSSGWNRRQIGHSIANVLHRYSSQQKEDSAKNSPAESRKDFRMEKRASQGALGKLCQVVFIEEGNLGSSKSSFD
uniref:Milton domain-containing protein n=1 Tax=Steinernema glaseri TaxID=37863 RepID=A0A1I7Y8G4_9BILA